MEKLVCVELHARPRKADQSIAPELEEITDGRTPDRTVFLCTNVTASLPVDGVVYVIDSCMINEIVTDPRNEVTKLYEVPASKASCMQRATLAGRFEPGVCYRMLSQYAYQRNCPDDGVPDILKSDMTSAVLTLLIAGMNPMTFPYPTRPALQTMMRALSNLKCLGLIEGIVDQGTEYAATSLGNKAALIPVEPHLARALLHSVESGCLLEIVIVAAMVTVQSRGSSIYRRPHGKQEEAKFVATCEKFTTGLGTHIDYLVIFNAYMCEKEQGFDKEDRFFERFFFDSSIL